MNTKPLPQLASMDDVTIEIARDMAHMLNTERVDAGDMLERFGIDREDPSIEDPSLTIDDPSNFTIDFCNEIWLRRFNGTWYAERY